MVWGDQDIEEPYNMNQIYKAIDLLPCASCIVTCNEVLSFQKINKSMQTLFGFQEEFDYDDLKSLLSYTDFQSIIKILEESKQKHILNVQFQSSYLLNQQVFYFAYEGVFMCDTDCMLLTISDITAFRDVEIELNYIRQQHDILMNHTGRVISQYELCTRTLCQPEKASRIFNLPNVIENVPYSIVDKIVAEESKDEYINFYESMMRGIPHGSITVRAKSAFGGYAWYVMQYDLIYNVDNCPVRATISYEDISDLQEKELAYKKWQNYFQSQQEQSIAYYEYNLTKDYFEIMEGELSDAYEKEEIHNLLEITKYATEHYIHCEDCERYINIFSRQRLLSQFYEGERECRFEHRRFRKNKMVWVLAIIQLISDPYTNDIKASILIKDIHEEKESMLHLRNLSMMDPLTGLLNRSTMIEQVDQLLQNSSLNDTHILLMIDLDEFKNLNDTMGHKFGDQVLLDIAKKLRNAVRAGDLCARLGGDEFIVLLKYSPVDEHFLQRIKSFHQQLNCSYGKTEASTSIGLASFPKDGWSFDDLYQRADIALYKAKRNGRNQFAIYNSCDSDALNKI